MPHSKASLIIPNGFSVIKIKKLELNETARSRIGAI